MFKNNRNKILQTIDNNAVIIIATNTEKQRNNDVFYPFRVESSFYYFTGFCEPNALMILSAQEYIVFMQDKDKTAEMWNGERLGLKKGAKKLDAKTKNIAKIKTELPKILKKYAKVYFDFENINTDFLEILTAKNYASLKEKVAKLRVIKSADEIKNIKTACKISDEAHSLAMQQVKNMEYEYQVQSVFDGFFTYNNTQHAYPPIVASGKNGLILHYTNNNTKLDKNALILIDAGCEVNNYASDITRTFPIFGRFSKAQKEVYEVVLQAQLAAIKSIKSGVSIKEPHNIATKIITQGLKDLGILTTQKVKEFFPHGTSHFLGLDVHDAGIYKKNNQDIALKKGMVLTVEPGIYITPSENIDKKYHNIAIRIEDDVLVGDDGCEVLSNAPKTIQEIEQIMS